MKSVLSATLFCTLAALYQAVAQCVVTASLTEPDIICGDCTVLNASGRGQGLSVFSENFNSGVPVGWDTTQQARFDNPCSPTGVDGTPHIWFGNSSGVPRLLRTIPYDLTPATAGVTVCFDLLFATQTGNSGTPCEGPDEPDEGVYLQYSTDGGVTWHTIHYFDPNGGTDPLLVNWNNWCFQLPQDAISPNTQIRWFQDNDSGADFDHWGLDNVVIYFNDPTYEIVWLNDNYSYGQGNSGGPHVVCPRVTTDYIVEMSNGFESCRDTVTVIVKDPLLALDAGEDVRVCAGECVTLNATAKVIKREAKTVTFANAEFTPVTAVFGSETSININVTGLNISRITPGSITQVCITGLSFFGTVIFPVPGQQTIGDLIIFLQCPDGTRITLVPQGVTTSVDPFTGYVNTCFTLNSTTSIATASLPYTGNFMPNQPFDNLVGCTANGLWSIVVVPASPGGFGVGTFSGWSITFSDPEISYPADFIWSPSTYMSDSNSLTPVICPQEDITYTLFATDSAGCVARTDSVTITIDSVALQINAQITAPQCGASDGIIDINVSGGSGNYVYVWSTGDTTEDVSGLGAGIYSVTITDLQHCQVDTSFILSTVNAPVINSISVTPESCRGEGDGQAIIDLDVSNPGSVFILWSNGMGGSSVSGLAAGRYTVTITDVNNCKTVTEVIIPAGPLCCSMITTALSSNTRCSYSCDGYAEIQPANGFPPFRYQWSDSGQQAAVRTDLCSGIYTVTVTDYNNCSVVDTVVIGSPPPVEVNLGENISLCEGHIVSLSPGSNWSVYQWSTGDTSSVLEVTQGGVYSVTVTTPVGCQGSDSVEITFISPYQVNAGEDRTIISGTSIPLTATVSGNPQGFFFWSPPVALSCTDCPSPVASPTEDITYVVTFSDSQECSGNDSITIRVLPEVIPPRIPDAFTPNGDGHNDVFEVKIFGGSGEVREFRVYNRWGELLHNSTTAWDGRYQGKDQPAGTYIYYAVTDMIDGTRIKLSGAFSLIR
ncbi:MAG: hypothetical protein KatS3mg031_2234 [Chitinophagales bacterium]|nr:MAG: hypothetical protein KatS3mg031_2234 [Chitinophagales bacterium]